MDYIKVNEIKFYGKTGFFYEFKVGQEIREKYGNVMGHTPFGFIKSIHLHRSRKMVTIYSSGRIRSTFGRITGVLVNADEDLVDVINRLEKMVDM